MLIQACQDNSSLAEVLGTDTAVPTSISDPLQNQHVKLQRPDTVLMLASVREGKALRGAFTGAIADELRSADGKKDIFKMFQRASRTVATDPECMKVDQHPELRATNTKDLVLPPAEPGRGVLIDR